MKYLDDQRDNPKFKKIREQVYHLASEAEKYGYALNYCFRRKQEGENKQ